MSSSVTSVVVAFELALILAGLVLLWRLALSRTARTAQTLSPLPRWEILPSGFVMIIWCVLMGGIAGQFVALQAAKWLPGVTADSRIVIVGGRISAGAAGRMAGFPLAPERPQRDDPLDARADQSAPRGCCHVSRRHAVSHRREPDVAIRLGKTRAARRTAGAH